MLTTVFGVGAVRSWKGSIAQILTPVAITLLLLLFQFISNTILSSQGVCELVIEAVVPSLMPMFSPSAVLYPDVHPIQKLPLCQGEATYGCKTLAYVYFML